MKKEELIYWFTYIPMLPWIFLVSILVFIEILKKIDMVDIMTKDPEDFVTDEIEEYGKSLFPPQWVEITISTLVYALFIITLI